MTQVGARLRRLTEAGSFMSSERVMRESGDGYWLAMIVAISQSKGSTQHICHKFQLVRGDLWRYMTMDTDTYNEYVCIPVYVREEVATTEFCTVVALVSIATRRGVCDNGRNDNHEEGRELDEE